jgi:hypothetical protein
MSGPLEIGRLVLIGCAVLFGLGWLVSFALFLRRMLAVLSGRSDLRSITLDPKLRFLRRFLFRVWLGALITGLLLIVLAFVLGDPHPR